MTSRVTWLSSDGLCPGREAEEEKSSRTSSGERQRSEQLD